MGNKLQCIVDDGLVTCHLSIYKRMLCYVNVCNNFDYDDRILPLDVVIKVSECTIE